MKGEGADPVVVALKSVERGGGKGVPEAEGFVAGGRDDELGGG